ncbi:MAG: hypothetical protein P4K86_04825 [Terracidiphilus sp.]|nr:hypothetical protein [Terracidiphilus sp.]
MKIVRGIAMAVLVFLCLSAIAGAVPMILDPSGRMMHMPLSLLEHSPFHTFLIPGIILLLANGVLSLVVLVAAARRWPRYAWAVALQGCILTGWIVVEVILLHLLIWAHYVYGAIGLALIVLGLVLARESRTA